MISNQPLIVVVGADGFVGNGFASGLQARRVVYGECVPGEVHISQAEGLLRQADVVINAGGFRVRRGLTLEDYRRCHQGATSLFVPWIRKGALFIQMSSAHVLGKSTRKELGNHSTPDPASYPSAPYAIAKLEADEYLKEESVDREFRVVFLRPTILWSRPGDTSLIDNLAKLAKRGFLLRLYPRNAKHHFCHLSLLVEVARRVIARDDIPNHTALLVADPYTVTSRGIEELIRQYCQSAWGVPMPSLVMSTLLRHTFNSSQPGLDLKTWGDIFGVLHLDTVYDASDTLRLLGIDPGNYSLERLLKPFIREAMRVGQPSGRAEATA